MNIDELHERLRILKTILARPGLYLKNFLDELTNEVDLAFFRKELNEKENNLLWLQLIERIHLFESVLLSNPICNKASNHELIRELDNEITNLADNHKESTDQLLKLVARLEHKIESLLFQNKTIMFLNQDDCEEMSWFNQEISVRLIIINDTYVSRHFVKSMKNK